MASGFGYIGKIPELRKRSLYTITLLAVYRIGAFVTTPGVNRAIMAKLVTQGSGSYLGLFIMFSGGALEQMSIFALGIMPYISASIILQLLPVVDPKLEQIQKEGQMGQRRLNQYTRYGCVILSLIQSFFIARWLESNNRAYAQFGQVVTDPGLRFRLMPDAATRMFSKARTGDITAFDLAIIGLVIVAVVAAIIFFERGQRKIPVQYAKRLVGRKMFGGQTTHLPLKVNTAGVIPPIFASSILMFPQQIASFVQTPWMNRISESLHPGDWRYNVLYIGLIFFFCYFYTAVTFNPVDVADNMKKYGGFLPGIRPGRATAEYIDRVLTRLTFGGALYISADS